VEEVPLFLGIPRRRVAAHEFVKSPLPFLERPSHICPKPARASVTTAGWLKKVNFAAWKPNEDAASVPSGRSGRLREINHEY
jgi:hypothetical protein